MSKFLDYIRDTRGEVKHVSWPSKASAIGFTILVILISLFMAFFLGFFDYLLSLVIQKFVL